MVTFGHPIIHMDKTL